LSLPEDFYDDDKNYRIRLCMTILDADPRLVVAGSKIHPCDRCDTLIWVNESQAVPPLPDGMELHGDVSVCFPCAQAIRDHSEVESPSWLGPTPEEYGIPDPFAP
jgi:hypothetical protein